MRRLHAGSVARPLSRRGNTSLNKRSGEIIYLALLLTGSLASIASFHIPLIDASEVTYLILLVVASLILIITLATIYLFNRIDKLKNNDDPSKDDWRVK